MDTNLVFHEIRVNTGRNAPSRLTLMPKDGPIVREPFV
jgi:hypothetical protein